MIRSNADAADKPDAFPGNKHLILGGCGFIGRHVAIVLARAGHSVVLADRFPPAFRFPGEIAGRISWRAADLISADWNALIEDVDTVHHYAWTSIPASANADPAGDLDVNVAATVRLLDAIRRQGRKRVVFSSSGGTVYGPLRNVPVGEDHPLQPINAYGAGKAAAELYLGLYRALYGLDCRIARIANAYGAGQSVTRGQGAVSRFLHCALSSQPIVIWGDGEVVRDYVHVTDVANALVQLALMPGCEQCYTFNVGNGLGLSLNDIVSQIEVLLGKRLQIRREAGRSFDVRVSVLDVSRARAVLNWKAALTFSDGIAQTLTDLAAGAPFSSGANNCLLAAAG